MGQVCTGILCTVARRTLPGTDLLLLTIDWIATYIPQSARPGHDISLSMVAQQVGIFLYKSCQLFTSSCIKMGKSSVYGSKSAIQLKFYIDWLIWIVWGNKIIKFTVVFGQWFVFTTRTYLKIIEISVRMWHTGVRTFQMIVMMMASGSSCHNIVNEYKYYFSHLTTRQALQH